MFAAHALRESNSHVYIRCTYNIIHAYNIDDLFHTGRIDLPGMEKIDHIVCTGMHNNTIANYIVLWSKTAAIYIGGVFFATILFLLS